MPERLDRVTVNVPDGDVTIGRATREVLMGILAQNEGAAVIRARFEAVGASRLVELTRGERVALRNLLGEWLLDDEDRPEEQGLTDLYIAVNRGEPWDGMVDIWDEGDAETGRGFGSGTWHWRWARWDERRYPDDDHQHCIFCHTNIEDDALTEAWLTLGDDDCERWVCAGCFDKLRDRFGWKVEPRQP